MSVDLQLLIGAAVPRPISLELTERLMKLEVHSGDKAPNGFELTFDADESVFSGYSVATESVLQQFNRVIIVASVNMRVQVLIDGFIKQADLVTEPSGTSKFVVKGEDVCGKMALVQTTASYSGMKDKVIVETILGKYAQFGLSMDVADAGVDAPRTSTPQQVGTDLFHVKKLAKRYGFRFYIKPGPAPGTSTAHWGPREAQPPWQPDLRANAGPTTNVETLTPNVRGGAGKMNRGIKMTLVDGKPTPVPVTVTGMTENTVAADPEPDSADAAIVMQPDAYTSLLQLLDSAATLLPNTVHDPALAQAVAEGITNTTSSRSVVARGTLDTARYGAILEAPGRVDVLGVGEKFEGEYYVEEVKHTFTRKDRVYRQDFVLTRDGLN